MGMGWLKNVGIALTTGTALVQGFGPLITALIPGTKDDQALGKINDTISEVGKIVVSAEAFGAALQLSGPDKLKAAIPLVSQVILQSAIMAGQRPADVAMFEAGVIEITNGMVKILGSKSVTSI